MTAPWLDMLIGRALRALGTPVTRRTAINFGTGFTVTDDPANDQTTITSAGGGGGGTGNQIVATQAALKALHAVDLADGQAFTVKSTNKVWLWSATTGATLAGDDLTITQLTETLTANAGRFYPATAGVSVPNMAALRAATSGKTDSTVLQGFYAASDWGEGHFDWNAASSVADDGGTVIAPTGVATGRWIRRVAGHRISVKWFGAKGDGTTDDRASIQLAVAYAVAHTVQVQTPSINPYQTTRGIEIFLPSGDYVIGSASSTPGAIGYNHGIELPGALTFVGENGTNILPAWKAVTFDNTTDTFTCNGHGLVAGDRVTVYVPNGGTVPAGYGANHCYFVRAGVTANTFTLSATSGGAAVNVTSNGASVRIARAIAPIRWQRRLGLIKRIQFVGGFDAIAMCGDTINYGTFGAFFGSNCEARIEDCRFYYQAGPAIWQDMTLHDATTGNYRTIDPISIKDCLFQGACAFWGASDKLTFTNCVFEWDQLAISTDSDANLPTQWRTSDNLPLGCINSADNVFLEHCFIEPLGAGGGQIWPPRLAFAVGSGDWHFNDTIWGETNGCFIRSKSAPTYQGIGYAAVSLSGATGNPPLIVKADRMLVACSSKNLFEIYEQPPKSIELSKFYTVNTNSSYGVWLNSDVDLAVIAKTHALNLVLHSDVYPSDFFRFRQSTEANGFTAVGGNPTGEPISTSANITNVSARFEQYHQHRDPRHAQGGNFPQNNLWFDGQYNITGGQVTAANTGVVSTANDTTFGFTLTKYTFSANPTTCIFGFTSDNWGASMPAGVYYFDFDLKTDFEGERLELSYTYNGTQSTVEASSVVGAGGFRRYGFAFYFPGISGGDTFTFQGAMHVPANGSVTAGRFQIVPGRKPAPYHLPVDSASAPTKNLVGSRQPMPYFASAAPASGRYQEGDIVWNNNPTALGSFVGWVAYTNAITSGTPTFGGFGALGTVSGDATDTYVNAPGASGHVKIRKNGIGGTVHTTVGDDAIVTTGFLQPNSGGFGVVLGGVAGNLNSFGAIGFGISTNPSTTNFSMLGDGTNTYLNAPAGGGFILLGCGGSSHQTLVLAQTYWKRLMPSYIAATALGNFAGGGSAGSAAATVDGFESITINQTTAGQSISIPDPTNIGGYSKPVAVSNVGSQAFALTGTGLSIAAVAPGTTALLFWTGAGWSKVS